MTTTDDLRTAMFGVSATELAKATGISRTQLLHFRAGRQELRLDKAERLAKALGLTITLEDNPPNPLPPCPPRAGEDRRPR